ncbi:MAG: hypothetical protein HQ591_08915 [candidate division Zixibacteria bacterium]|nr:hypothetical protein [Candidatus Tariuqbacter arcticus]
MIHRIRPLLYPDKKIHILSRTPLPLAAKIIQLSTVEYESMLGLKLNSQSKVTGTDTTYNRLSQAITQLRYKHYTNFTYQKLADTARVNRRTVERYAERLCADISGLTKTPTGFELKEDNDPFS